LRLLKKKYGKRIWFLGVETHDNRRGIPDVLVCLNGHFIALEFKRSIKELGKSRTKMQEYVASLILSAGGLSLFIYPENEQECLSILHKYALTNPVKGDHH
jgi:hypothetical protein